MKPMNTGTFIFFGILLLIGGSLLGSVRSKQLNDMSAVSTQKQFVPYRDTKIVKGCVHHEPSVGVTFVTPDFCATGTAYLYHAGAGVTYIERFDDDLGPPVLLTDTPYPGAGYDQSKMGYWIFNE